MLNYECNGDQHKNINVMHHINKTEGKTLAKKKKKKNLVKRELQHEKKHYEKKTANIIFTGKTKHVPLLYDHLEKKRSIQ